MPKFILNWYHRNLALLAAFYYGNPSEKMIVIGVTGTNGKSTTVALIAKALEAGGEKVGATSTVSFKVAEKEWLNNKKMTMLGRFQLQKFLCQMKDAGCKYAVIETSSQGIDQFRHLGINYDYAVFTNLTPEHIEAHGGFENYKQAKGKLFEHLASSPRKILDGKKIEKTSVINFDDKYSDYFAEFKADKVLFYSIEGTDVNGLVAENVDPTPLGTSFEVNEQKINLKLLGAFNVYNSLPAILIAEQEGIGFADIKNALQAITVVPGRMQLIDQAQDFWAIVDYAPEPASMAKLYETIKKFQEQEEMKINRIIHVFGSCGGGRDRERRPILGQIAGENAHFAIVTNEDPYDDDPMEIIDEVAAGAIKAGKELNKNLFKILDRKKAIAKALSLAKTGDLVLVTGKGAEQKMAVANGNYVNWDDREVIRELLQSGKCKVES